MTKFTLRAAGCATLLWTAMALAGPTPQEQCRGARVTEWAKYVSCVDGVVAKDAKGVRFDEFAAFAKCRHAYFTKWTGFQTDRSLAGSTCIGSRFTDNGDGTVTDNLSGLLWERKTNLDGAANLADPHDADNPYTWSTGDPFKEDGTAFTSFIGTVNGGGGLGGANDWRLPTLAELQTIVLDFACTGTGGGSTCTCGSSPCIDGTFGPTQLRYYWSATSWASSPGSAWGVSFSDGGVDVADKTGSAYVRAVRGGW